MDKIPYGQLPTPIPTMVPLAEMHKRAAAEAQQVKQPEGVPDLARQINSLRKNVEHIATLAQEMEKRLRPLLAPPSQPPEPQDKIPSTARTEVGRIIEQECDGLEISVLLLTRILTHLEM